MMLKFAYQDFLDRRHQTVRSFPLQNYDTASFLVDFMGYWPIYRGR